MLSYEELYEKYATDVLRVSYFYLGDRQRAEDVCQDVFVRLMTNAPDLQEGREKAWLLKVALNRCRDLWRGAWLKRVVLGSPAFEMIPAPDDSGRRDDEGRLPRRGLERTLRAQGAYRALAHKELMKHRPLPP